MAESLDLDGQNGYPTGLNVDLQGVARNHASSERHFQPNPRQSSLPLSWQWN
jgi:hypothetical protein